MLANRLPKVKGTKKVIATNQLLISTGLPSLDIIIGGGIPVGSLFLLEEDEFGTFSKVILKHYLVEGIVSNHALLFTSPQMNARKFISELPAPITAPITGGRLNQKDDSLPNVGELKIAWRYQDKPHESSEPSAALFGHTYDLSKRIGRSYLNNAEVNYWQCPPEGNNYNSLFSSIQEFAQDAKYNLNAPVENRTVLRIALHFLGNALWEGEFDKFLMKLRILLRNTSSTCFITVAPHLFDQKFLLHRCEHLCDTIIRVQSLLNDGNPAYSDYDGLLFLEKLPIINNWNCYVPESNDWAFKLNKRHFRIEKLHISPDIKENIHREGEDVSKEYETQKIVANVANEF